MGQDGFIRFGFDRKQRLHAFLDMKEWDDYGRLLTPTDGKTAWRIMSDTLRNEYRHLHWWTRSPGRYGWANTPCSRARLYGDVYPELVHDGRMNIPVLTRIERNSWEGETWIRDVALQTSADLDLARRLCAVWRPGDYGNWGLRVIKVSDLRPYQSMGGWGYMAGYGFLPMTPGLRRDLRKVLDYALLGDDRVRSEHLDALLYKMAIFRKGSEC